MSEHTKGSWIAAPYSSVVGAPVVSTTGRPVAKVVYFQLGEGFENHERESIANGRLIAAAPDLLNSLTEALGFLEYGGFDLSSAKAAISKATGAEPQIPSPSPIVQVTDEMVEAIVERAARYARVIPRTVARQGAIAEAYIAGALAQASEGGR